MLNALCVKPIDYKSIALPAELQGHKLFLCDFYFKRLIKSMDKKPNCYARRCCGSHQLLEL